MIRKRTRTTTRTTYAEDSIDGVASEDAECDVAIYGCRSGRPGRAAAAAYVALKGPGAQHPRQLHGHGH